MKFRFRNRLGFSLSEMMVVVVISGILLSIALPKTKTLRDKSSVRAAKQQVASYLAIARASAIRRSQPAQFYLVNNKVWATYGSTTRTSVGGSVQLDVLRGVAVTLSGATANDSVIYDSRGIGTLSASRTYKITKNSSSDSLCVSKLGLIARYCGQ
jgi:prepilin-type N-terminal cleavage/methylation domain-containing protein